MRFYNNNIFHHRYVINMSIMQDVSELSSICEYFDDFEIKLSFLRKFD